MIYYMIRHKKSGELMPELKRRGYSHWNPDRVDTRENLKSCLTGCPRLFHSIKQARNSISQWNAMPNARNSFSTSYLGEDDEILDIKPDNRSKDDLEVVEVSIEEIQVMAKL